MISLHTKFHMSSSNASLINTIKVKTKYRLHATAMLLFYILKKKLA